MIARTWRGAVSTTDADDYVDYLEETGVPEYAATAGLGREPESAVRR